MEKSVHVLKQRVAEKRCINKVKDLILTTYKSNMLRKALFGLQTNVYDQRRAKIVQQRSALTTLAAMMDRWREQTGKSQVVQGMFDILQAQHEKKMVRQFLPNLLHYGYFKVRTDIIIGHRDKKLAKTAMSGFKRLLLLKRIPSIFQKMRLMKLFKGFFNHAQVRIAYRENISKALDIQEQEDEFYSQKDVFIALKENILYQK